MKRFGLPALLLLALTALITGCTPTVNPKSGVLDIDVTALALANAGTVNVELGQVLSLVHTVTPANANTGETWVSANTAIATVSGDGQVTPVAVGSTTISLSSSKDPSIKATCTVAVYPVGGIVALDSFGFYNQVGVLDGTTAAKPYLLNQRIDLVNPSTDGLVKNILTKNSMLYLAAPQTGNFRLRARFTISEIYTALGVNGTGSSDRGVSIGAFAQTAAGEFGDATKFAALLYRTRGDVRSFYTDNTGANSAGSPNLAATTETWAVERILEVARTDAGYSFNIYNGKTDTLEAGGSATVSNAGLAPELTLTNPVYLCLTVSGAKVSFSNIELYAGPTGSETAIFKSTAVAANPVAVKGVTVTGPARNPTAAYNYQNSLAGAQADTIQLAAAVTPAWSDNTAVKWSSNAAGVATVGVDSGLVSVVGAGAATITATTVDGSFTAAYNLNITAAALPVTGITVTGTATAMAGLTTTLGTTIAPTDATNQTVTWTSSNTLVATVNAATGLVTGVNPGTATITATATDGSGVTDTVSVTVTAAVNTIFSWTAGAQADFVLSAPTTVSGKTLVGRSALASSLNFASTGLVMANNRFVIGSTYYDATTGGATLGTTTASYLPPDGQFDFSTKKAKVTVTYASYTPPAPPSTNTFDVYLNNNTASSGASIHGSLSKLSPTHSVGTGFVTTGGSVAYTIDPANFAAAGASSLNTSFIQLRSGSGVTIAITGILIEYLP
jgi:uncharacterized protein YjdB